METKEMYFLMMQLKKKKIATRWKTAISFAEQKVELAAAVPPPYYMQVAIAKTAILRKAQGMAMLVAGLAVVAQMIDPAMDTYQRIN